MKLAPLVPAAAADWLPLAVAVAAAVVVIVGLFGTGARTDTALRHARQPLQMVGSPVA